MKRLAIGAGALVCLSVWQPASVRASGQDCVVFSANDEMKFSRTHLVSQVGQPLTIVLTNDGSLMAHNQVLLIPGTDVMVFEESAVRQASSGYLPNDAQAQKVVFHTRMLDGGDSDKITFIPAAAGTYEFICTYPGYLAAGMRGEITVAP